MCNAWNDRLDMVPDEPAFLLRFPTMAQSTLENFVLIYRDQTVNIFSQWLRQDPYVNPDNGTIYENIYNSYLDTIIQAKTLLKRLQQWCEQYQALEREEITGAEYWYIVRLLEDLIDTMDDNTMYNFVQMQKHAGKQFQPQLDDAMNKGGIAFNNFRDSVVKVLHSEIDKLRIAA